MNPILLIDKPSGITSFDVIRQLRRKLGIKKMGHAGTLDPLATGLLIIATGPATKQISNYMNLDKEYEALIEFGKVSNTYDADGTVESFGVELSNITQQNFQENLKTFIGIIQQTPPAFSAVRIKGQHAYDLARKGIKVELQPRTVTINRIEILDFSWPLVRLKIACGKGTYIRSLAHDLGQKLGCGGYIKELRRTAIGEFRVENAERL
ncbi:MAG: tRNA pseudouridine(55) synthase TruB [Patescibacteria group bacterium]